MKIKGDALKKMVNEGLGQYDQHLTLTLSKTFMDFSDQIDPAREYDLFSVVSVLILKANEDGAPLVSELMKAVDREDLETMDYHLVSSIGYFINDHLKGQKALSVFQAQESSGEAASERPKLRPIADQEQHQSEHH